MIDFSLPADLIALRDKYEAFIRDVIVPLERDPRQGPHGPEEALRLEMVREARAEKLLSPHGPRERLITVKENASLEDARSLMHKHRIERVMAAGPPASVLVYMVAPQKLIGWNRKPAPAW